MNSLIGFISIFIFYENNYVIYVVIKVEEELGSIINWVYRFCVVNVMWLNFFLKYCILWEYLKY